MKFYSGIKTDGSVKLIFPPIFALQTFAISRNPNISFLRSNLDFLDHLRG